MALHSATVGSVGQPFVSEIDARWVMSYAAGLDDYLPCYMDTCRPDGIVAHPLFPVCIEWPVLLAMRDSALKREEALRGVHATHDLVVHRLIRAGEKLTTQATVAGVEQRKPGAYQTVRFDTRDTDGQPVCSTWYGTLFRGVDVEGEDSPVSDLPTPLEPLDAATGAKAEIPVAISAGAAPCLHRVRAYLEPYSHRPGSGRAVRVAGADPAWNRHAGAWHLPCHCPGNRRPPGTGQTYHRALWCHGVYALTSDRPDRVAGGEYGGRRGAV